LQGEFLSKSGYLYFDICPHFYRENKIEPNEKKCASAGSRTRICCLEGNNDNRYTTDAIHFFQDKAEFLDFFDGFIKKIEHKSIDQ
jgi:hypothetical protein